MRYKTLKYIGRLIQKLFLNKFFGLFIFFVVFIDMALTVVCYGLGYAEATFLIHPLLNCLLCVWILGMMIDIEIMETNKGVY